MAERDEAPPLSAAMALAVAGRRAQRELDAALEGLGISMRHLGALGHLSRNDELTVSDLARRSRITAQSMHVTIRDLEARGALGRSSSDRGKRAQLSVTSEGRRLLRRGREAVAAVDERLLAEMEWLDQETLAGLARFGFE